MPKKKILHVIQSLGNGGCENMLLRTLPLLSDGFEHHIIALRELGELAPHFAEKGIPVTTVHWGGLFDIPGYRRLISETKQFAPDAIITYLFHADMIGRLFLQPVLSFFSSISPARGEISSLRDSIPIIPFLRTTYNHPKYLIARVLEWLTKPLVKQYLANSEAVKDFYIKHIGVRPEKITVIPNGIDANYFDSIIPDPKLKESLGIKPDDFVIICVANLHINKGHRYLLEAFESLSLRGSEALAAVQSSHLKLLLVGDGTERKNLEQQIRNYQSKGDILFLGRRTDIPQLLKISNLFVLPTLFEGQSNAIMEAMASGLPVITTDIPENRSLIENEKTGMLFPAGDICSLKKAIERLMNNPTLANRMRFDAQHKAEVDFNIRVIVSQFSNFYREI